MISVIRTIGCSILAAVAVTGMAVDAHAGPGQGRSIELILDASGSMNATLASGQTKIAAAKEAVAAVIGELDPDQRVAYRVYGHQSPTAERNCEDTELMVAFDSASANRNAIVAKNAGVTAQGYTPIAYVIQRAAEDIADEPGERTVVLVSDGEETCGGDPCTAAEDIADADAELVVHVIGFDVNAAESGQLECIAAGVRGKYYAASDAPELGQVLRVAVVEEESDRACYEQAGIQYCLVNVARNPEQTTVVVTIEVTNLLDDPLWAIWVLPAPVLTDDRANEMGAADISGHDHCYRPDGGWECWRWDQPQFTVLSANSPSLVRISFRQSEDNPGSPRMDGAVASLTGRLWIVTADGETGLALSISIPLIELPTSEPRE